MIQETTCAGWAKVQDTLRGRYKEICHALRAQGTAVTARELRRYMKQAGTYRYWEYTWTYMSKLERNGLVRRCPAVRCTDTGSMAAAWRLATEQEYEEYWEAQSECR